MTKMKKKMKMKMKRMMKMKMQIRKTMKMRTMTMKKKMKMISAAGVRVCGPEQRVGWLAAVVRGGRTPHTVGVARHHQPPLLGPEASSPPPSAVAAIVDRAPVRLDTESHSSREGRPRAYLRPGGPPPRGPDRLGELERVLVDLGHVGRVVGRLGVAPHVAHPPMVLVVGRLHDLVRRHRL
jgi:hypothetical protein